MSKPQGERRRKVNGEQELLQRDGAKIGKTAKLNFMWGETIQVTALKGGLALANGDAMRRLHELGVKRTRRHAAKNTRVRRSARAKVQDDFLWGYPSIRDLDHYRQIVSDPRSKGPMTSFDRGMTLTMELTNHPWKKEEQWYVLLDTAIGCNVDFLQEMHKNGSVRIVALDSPSTSSGS